MGVCSNNNTMSTTIPTVKMLIDELVRHPPGPITEGRDRVLDYLREAWDDFEGAHDEKMEAYKLQPDRVENLRWYPPVLSFGIVRHGSTALGSIYGEVQGWDANLDTLWAASSVGRKRQVSPADKRLDTLKLARKVAALIKNHRESPMLRWISDDLVRVNIAVVIPKTIKQTTVGRRYRFAGDLAAVLQPLGWSRAPGKAAHTYARTRPPSD